MQQQNELYPTDHRAAAQTDQSSWIILSVLRRLSVISNLPLLFCQFGLSLLLTSETGVGKEVFANALHQLQQPKCQQLCQDQLRCYSKDLLESELFGYEAVHSEAPKGRQNRQSLNWPMEVLCFWMKSEKCPFRSSPNFCGFLQEKKK